MRKNFGARPLSYPQAVYMLATYNEDGTANIMNAAWGGLSDASELTLCISASHKTTKNFLRTGALTVSMGDAAHMTACDYLGMVSGEKTAEKVERSGFTLSKSERVDAPIINELAICLECRVKSYDAESGRLVAEIVNVSVDESGMTGDQVDCEKIRPIVFDAFNGCYREIGKPVGKAFSCGKELMK